jgi:hypothetical protein
MLPASAWLKFLDEETLKPLEPVELALDQHDGEERRAQSIDAGRSCDLQVAVAGYVPLSATFVPEEGENRVLLQRAGSVTIVLRDREGQPVEGVSVTLLPPSATERGLGARGLESVPLDPGPRKLMRTPLGWTLCEEPILLSDGEVAPAACSEILSKRSRTTDSSGTATWDGLAALDGYRWAVAPPRHADLTPPHEKKRFEEAGPELLVGSPPPEGVSGRFEVKGGERLKLEGVVLSGASVFGRIACSAADGPACVTLFKVSAGGGSTATQAMSFDAVAARDAEEDGGFRFDDIRPGTWLVRAWWVEGGRDFYFVARAFRLDAGADLDLGVLTALDGMSLAVSLGIEDSDGQVLDPTLVYPEDELVPFAVLSIHVNPTSGNVAHLTSGLMALPLGETYRFHGLQPGMVFADLQPGPGLAPDAEWVCSLSAAQPAPFEVGTQEELRLALVAHTGVARAMVVRDPSGEALSVAALWVHDLATGRLTWVTTHPSDCEEGGASQQLTLPPGTYHLWCKVSTDEQPAGLVGTARATFARGNDDNIEIVLQPAASITAIVRDRSGRPVAHRNLAWTCEDWPTGGRQGSLYSAVTDGQGNFTLPEMPVGMRLLGAEPGTDLLALQPGALPRVELSLTR